MASRGGPFGFEQIMYKRTKDVLSCTDGRRRTEIRDAGRGPAAAAGFARGWAGGPWRVAAARSASLPGRPVGGAVRSARSVRSPAKGAASPWNRSKRARILRARPVGALHPGSRPRGARKGRDRRIRPQMAPQTVGIARNMPGFSRRVQVPLLDSAAARIWLSVVAGVIASGSIFTWMIAGRPELSARSNAGKNSAVSSTVSPWPPKARA